MLSGLYSALYAAALAALLPFEYLKRPAEVRKRWLRERFGFYTGAQPASRPVWIHAVSVGEVIASVPLIKKIKELHPSLDLIISTVTDTGQKVARERAGAYADVIYVPFDLPLAVGKALNHIRPSVFIIMETELWPHIIRMTKERNVPVILMNGRVSGHSYKRYKRMGFLIRKVLRNVSLLCVQNELYAERFRNLGAAPEQIKVIGSFKFDTHPPSTVPEWAHALHGPVIIAGSTHETEEDIILDAYVRLRSGFTRLSLIIAPRHPERFKAVEELLKRRGLDYMKRSELTGNTEAGSVILLDVIGELSSVYGAADIAVIGGSFIEHGGQNPLEPAFWGKAIVCGPHMENFPFIQEFYTKKGAVCSDASSLYTVLKELLESPERMHRMGSTARELYQKDAGATERAMEIIERYIGDRGNRHADAS